MSQFPFLDQLREDVKDELPEAWSPCPFCGSLNLDLEGRRSINVVCSNCKAEGPAVKEEEPRAAVRLAVHLWNKRVRLP